jgi:hypothetical protein
MVAGDRADALDALDRAASSIVPLRSPTATT